MGRRRPIRRRGNAPMDRDDDIPIHSGIEASTRCSAVSLTPDRFYLVEGRPGAGKTTLALQFLLGACSVARPCWRMTLSEFGTGTAGGGALTLAGRSRGRKRRSVGITWLQAATLAPNR